MKKKKWNTIIKIDDDNAAGTVSDITHNMYSSLLKKCFAEYKYIWWTDRYFFLPQLHMNICWSECRNLRTFTINKSYTWDTEIGVSFMNVIQSDEPSRSTATISI